MSTKLRDRLNKDLGDLALSIYDEGPRRIRIEISPENIKEAISRLTRQGYIRFVTASCIDNGIDFEILYHIDISGNIITLQVTIPKETAKIQSIASVLPNAAWIECEINELFGLEFEGNPRPTKLISPEGWSTKSPPLRAPHQGNIVEAHRGAIETLLNLGSTMPLSSFVEKRRGQVGLSSPEISFTDEKALKEIQGIYKSVKLDKEAGYDWNKGKLRYK